MQAYFPAHSCIRYKVIGGPWHCKFGSDHIGICQFLFSDGHVVNLNNLTSMNVLNVLAVRNDGQAVDGY